MGSVLFRNRYWWYRSLYDDYCGREMRMAFGLASFIWIPHYLHGVHLNRSMEVNFSHKQYQLEWGPRRNRLTHSLALEFFDTALENWDTLDQEFATKGKAMLTEQ